MLKDSLQQWRIVAHAREDQLAEPPYAISVPVAGSPFTARYGELREPLYVDVATQESEVWPGTAGLPPPRPVSWAWCSTRWCSARAASASWS